MDNFIQSNGLKGVECTLYEAAYITPEQYKERTGKDWPENWAVYWRTRDNGKWLSWFPMTLEMGEFAMVKTVGEHQIVCATEAGKPPNDWKPEEELRV
jgi:hypothetical protein